MDDDIDVFAELGVEPSSPTSTAGDEDLLGLLADAPQAGQEDPLAALIEEDEADAFTVQPEPSTPTSEPVTTPPSAPAADLPRTLSTEMVGKVIAFEAVLKRKPTHGLGDVHGELRQRGSDGLHRLVALLGDDR